MTDETGLREAAQGIIDFWETESEVLQLHIDTLRTALAANPAPAECRSRGGMNRIDYCVTHDSPWPVDADRCPPGEREETP